MEFTPFNKQISATIFTSDNILNFTQSENIFYHLLPEELVSQAIEKGEGVLSSTGALVIDTGKFTGRSPKDRFIVKDSLTENLVNWNDFNQPIEEKYFDGLFQKMKNHSSDRKLWVRDCYVCSKSEYRLNIRIINENPCCNLFAYNMFLRPHNEELEHLQPDWHLFQFPSFLADPLNDGMRQENFIILNFTKKIILIGGTQYTGEIKKAVFTVLNFLLPYHKNILSMHCAANEGEEKDCALFFGLSGTGKTTLSADPSRKLIGDDEHGWDEESVFNFEGGCYAKTIHLKQQNEPEIYNAIRFGSIVENVKFVKDTKIIDFDNSQITENTRASYPIYYIDNALKTSIGNTPKNIFFLTADAYGILPPISRLSIEQAMYYFISGYTSKIAGTELGVYEPIPTFSACFGAPFIPLSPLFYATMLGEKILKEKVKVWMLNTGWAGGAYGTGERMKLEYTRLLLAAALENYLDRVSYSVHAIFNLMIPDRCPGVPTKLLNPQLAWQDKDAYKTTASMLAGFFTKNFEKYKSLVSEDILAGGPPY